MCKLPNTPDLNECVNQHWKMNEYDKQMAQELGAYLPPLPRRIFDIHAHVYNLTHLNLADESGYLYEGPQEASIQAWREHVGGLFTDRLLRGGMFFPTPAPLMDMRSANEYIVNQLANETSCRGLVMITPDDEPERIRTYLDCPQIAGFKPYPIFSKEKPVMQSSISGFCPDWMWEIANERKYVVMLHLVKDKAVADPDNIREIREICTKYPDMKLILAHTARCFHAFHAEPGISALRGLDNVYFDTSAVCEPEAMKVVLRYFGPSKLMWGSDFPDSHIRGKSVTVGDGFVWLMAPEFCSWDKAQMAHPVLLGLESLRAVIHAADDCGLNAEELDDIFYGNAEKLLGIG
ncbi:amidohydrolase family protein [Paenibacillus eucommiae]|uniref:Glutamate-1-semialdehyde 2,1-aminomutase n=1 Tax=Paenibacillus eucommiae TaxID=1355755 RepID=A0ABS4IRB1_9BACL|nr:amidohydrolase family protein [Paenibacillus eucommiae]MBP1990108.1 glutamate-1-semialdehyde 2,1-aminomutase [Paenibacillus eucommiae]